MKALIVYDSNFGNTRKVADALADEIGEARSIPVVDFKKEDLEGKDILIVGSPINAWRPTGRIIEFLNHLEAGSKTNIRTAAFDTRVKSFMSGNAARRIDRKLYSLGFERAGGPAGFYVKGNEGPLLDGELVRAKEWARSILASVENKK